MWLSRIPAVLALFFWGSLALMGYQAMLDIAAQGVPDHLNAGQRFYYLQIPLSMSLLSILLIAASLRGRWTGPVGCLAAILMLCLLPYLLPYTGGV